MDRPSDQREQVLRGELRAALAGLDRRILAGMAKALEYNRDRLVGGSWGTDDADGCLLTLTAAEIGADGGEDLLLTSIAAVRIPALFDELWALMVARTGDAATARQVTHRLVVEALVRHDGQGDGTSEPGDSSLETARSARPR
jgi:hypothetical protein